MASRMEIKCINKDDRDNPYERITHIGGTNSDGTRWRTTQREAIRETEAGEWEYYVELPHGDRVEVIVAISRYGNKYIKTEADEDEPNNLLSLPECP